MILGLASSLFRLFREHSDVVPVSRLRKQGVRSVTVLDWERVERLLARAVEQALERHGADLSPQALATINQEAREAFARLVEQRDSFRDSARSLEQEKSQLLANLMLLRGEIESSSGALARERRRTVSLDEVAVGARGMQEYGRRLEEEVRALLAGEGGAGGSGATAGSIAAIARRLLDEERGRALDSARAEQRHRVLQLERRVDKLTRTLAETESLVDRLQRMKAGDPGIESIYREVQGLDAADPRAAEKRSLLDEIFKLNMELRAVIQDAQAGAEQGRA
ncbi:MAG: hypothetical protein HY812_00700 [Planctomycetes bacterium]|nr:hypothetical protein [Planctomycetota bacterium]